MTQYYESEVLYHLMEREGFNIPSSVPKYESEIKAYLIEQVKLAYPKLTDYEAEWLLYNYTKHLPADFPLSSVTNVTKASFENVVPFAYQKAILKGNTKYRDIDTGDILDTFDETKNLELVSVKLPVLTTTGKNLFDIEKSLSISGKYTVALGDGSLQFPQNSDRTYLTISGGTFKENTPYTVRYDKVSGQCEFCFVYTDNTEGEKVLNNSTSDPNKTLKYLRNNWTDGSTSIIKNIQIEEGSVATPYEPHKSNILTVNEEVELRGIGDVQDTLDCLTGELTERIGEDVLDGSESWSQYNNVEGFETYGYFAYFKGTYKGILCDRFKESANKNIQPDYPSVKDEEAICIEGDYVKIRIKNISTVADLKLYLSQNPITVQYQLATESIKTVELKTVNEKGEITHFMPLEGTMNVQSSGEIIQPTFDMSVPVEATTQNLASFVDLEMEE